MDSEILLRRTKKFALDVIKYCQSLPKGIDSTILIKQLIRAGTSVAANYRAACRSRSDNEFYAKLCIVVEESDESLFWLELIEEAGISEAAEIKVLKKEAEELLFIFSSSRKTVKQRLSSKS